MQALTLLWETVVDRSRDRSRKFQFELKKSAEENVVDRSRP